MEGFVRSLRRIWVTTRSKALSVVPITRFGVALAVLAAASWFTAVRSGWREAALVAAGAVLLLLLAVPFLFRRGSFSSTLEVGPKDRVKVNEPCP